MTRDNNDVSPDIFGCGCMLVVIACGLAFLIICAGVSWRIVRWAWQVGFG